MECGPSEYVCQIMQWVLKNAEVLRDIPKLVGIFEGAFKEGGWAITFINQHGERLVALASLAFATYKWWVYRERILHKRLEEYIEESDRRLGPASGQVVEALLRPGRTATLPQPTFAVELRELLYRHSWAYGFGLFTPEAEANWRLGRALGGVRKRIRTAREAQRSLQDQQASVHMIAGAVAASRARRSQDSTKARSADQRALREFQKVLLVPGHQRSVSAKENEAFQFLRLGKPDFAFQAYIELEEFSADLPRQRDKDLVVARAKRFRAQILQVQAAGPSLAAWALVRPDPANPLISTALNLRAKYQTFEDWECIEQAEIHYVAAYVAFRNGFVVQQPIQLASAGSCYRDVLDSRRWFSSRASRALRLAAKEGLARVERATIQKQYDSRWLGI